MADLQSLEKFEFQNLDLRGLWEMPLGHKSGLLLQK